MKGLKAEAKVAPEWPRRFSEVVSVRCLSPSRSWPPPVSPQPSSLPPSCRRLRLVDLSAISMVATMAALISREEPDPDILSKFSAVAVARTACIEDNRARENARENIRKKLAMEAGREKVDTCDLQVNFSIRGSTLIELSRSVL